MCEEFHCTPLEALEQPYDLALTIMHMRGYAEAKRMIDNARSQGDIVPGPAIDEVREIKEQLWQEQRNAKR